MSLEERALEILREHEDESDSSSDAEDPPLDVEQDVEEVHDISDDDADELEVKEPSVRRLCADDDDDDDDDDVADELYELILKTRYTEPLKGSPYVRKHDDTLCMDITSNIYYDHE